MKIHFIGIGGIGMSALAQYYLAKGHKVSGSDLTSSEMTELLRKKGAEIFIGSHNLQLTTRSLQPELVIYTPAVDKNDPELMAARKLGIKMLSYPEALGELTKKYFTIAVAGTHGKSTTTAMLAMVLMKAGLDPTVIVGTKVKEFTDNSFSSIDEKELPTTEKASNFRMGKSKYLVIEADEHFASFLHYWPKIIVLTNIEEDHLDYYKNIKNIKKAFRKFIGHLPRGGVLVTNKDDENQSTQIILSARPSPQQIEGSGSKFKILNYSLQQIEVSRLRKILQVPGEHNVSNALAALGAARALRIPDKISLRALSEYRGAWRRFEKVSSFKFKVISDYAHHPTEIKATIWAAREKFPGKKIWAVFQPHQTARTIALFDGFVKAFDEADAVILTDIFEVAGREIKKPPRGKDARSLAAKIKKRKKETFFVQDFKKIPTFLKKKVGAEDIVLIMGAGDIYQIASPEYWKK